MLERAEELKQRVRRTPLPERLVEARSRIGKMCSEGRPPRMTIPVQHDDDDFYISTTLADAQATIADLQGQVEAARKKVEEMNAWVSAMSTANIATMAHTSEMQERALEAEQRVAQLEAWQDGVVKAFVDAPLEWSPSLGVPHIPTCLPQIFRNMKDCADKLTTLQADHARVLGLVQALGVVGLPAEHTRPDDFILLKTGEGWMAHTYNYWAKFATEEEARAYIALLEYRASLPAQRAKLAQGGV